jgi:hypothetical protein
LARLSDDGRVGNIEMDIKEIGRVYVNLIQVSVRGAVADFFLTR